MGWVVGSGGRDDEGTRRGTRAVRGDHHGTRAASIGGRQPGSMGAHPIPLTQTPNPIPNPKRNLGRAVKVHRDGLCARAAVAQPASHQLVRASMVHVLEELHACLGRGLSWGWGYG